MKLLDLFLFLFILVGCNAAVSNRKVAQETAAAASVDNSLSEVAGLMVFNTNATNLTGLGVNNTTNIYLYKESTGRQSLITESQDNSQDGSFASYAADISPDGAWVVFVSKADNLVAGTTNTNWQIYKRDVEGRTTTLISQDGGGGEGDGASFNPTLSNDGKLIAFQSKAQNLGADINCDGTNHHIYLVNENDGSKTLITRANGGGCSDGNSYDPVMSGDGRYIVFHSDSTDLIIGDTNGVGDIFLYDRNDTSIRRISLQSDGSETTGETNYPQISNNGEKVVYCADNTNGVTGQTGAADNEVILYDMATGDKSVVSLDESDVAKPVFCDARQRLSISNDGRLVAFIEASGGVSLVATDTNGKRDAYVRDTVLNTTTQVSKAVDGTGTDEIVTGLEFSPIGYSLAFTTKASNLSALDASTTRKTFLYNLSTSTMYLMSYDHNGAAVSNNDSAVFATP
jgi:Tol biopolymer transport system component